MPTYDYECDACGHTLEIFQGINEPKKKKCPECGKLKLRRLLGAGAAVVFKGSGFYQTDYRSESYKKAKAAEPKKEAKKESAPKKAAPKKDAAGDDLSKISGVGPVIVGKLEKLGITTFQQIADFTADDIARIDEELNFKGRIERDDWVAQAKQFLNEEA